MFAQRVRRKTLFFSLRLIRTKEDCRHDECNDALEGNNGDGDGALYRGHRGILSVANRHVDLQAQDEGVVKGNETVVTVAREPVVQRGKGRDGRKVGREQLSKTRLDLSCIEIQ